MDRKYKLVAFLCLMIVVLFVFRVLSYTSEPNSKQTNVIVISIDSLRADHMSLYGYDRKTTPNIDQWAQGALVFNNYYATSYLTPISEASVHTGDYPITTGVINFQSSVRDNVLTLAQLLQEHGWRTAAFGSSPEFSAYPAIAASFSKGFSVYQIAQPGTDQYNGRAEDSVNQAMGWLKSNAKSSTGEPFYLWLPVGSIHWPYGKDAKDYFTDPAYSGFLKNIPAAQWDPYGYIYKDTEYQYDSVHGTMLPLRNVSSADYAYVTGRYDDGILATDEKLGELFKYLHTSGLDKNTIVILESEHGEDFGERGYIAHYDIYNEQTHTPLIVYAPNLVPQRVSALASGVDVLPTLLDLLKLPKPSVDGVSFAPFVTKATSTLPRTEVYTTRTSLWERVITYASYVKLNGFLAADEKQHFYDTAVQNTQWKLIHRLSRNIQAQYGWWGILTNNPQTPPEYELYNLSVDPREKNNVYTEYTSNVSVISLQQKVSAWEATMKRMLPGPTLQPEQIQPYF